MERILVSLEHSHLSQHLTHPYCIALGKPPPPGLIWIIHIHQTDSQSTLPLKQKTKDLNFKSSFKEIQKGRDNQKNGNNKQNKIRYLWIVHQKGFVDALVCFPGSFIGSKMNFPDGFSCGKWKSFSSLKTLMLHEWLDPRPLVEWTQLVNKRVFILILAATILAGTTTFSNDGTTFWFPSRKENTRKLFCFCCLLIWCS